MRAIQVIFISLLLSCVNASNADWPQFRGPERDGVWRESGLVEQFPSGGLAIAWRQPVSYGWSSPVIADGRVIVTDAQYVNGRVQERVICFGEKAGTTKWIVSYAVKYPEWAFVDGQQAGPTATPVIENDRVYVIGALGRVHCLRARDGHVIWSRDLAKDFAVGEMSCRPSPLIDGDLLISCVGGKPGACVVALDKRTGRDVWKALDDRVSNSSPVIINAGGKRQLIIWSNDSIASLDPQSGSIWWREALTTSGNDSIPTPVIEGNRLLISGLMLHLDSSKAAATIVWPETRAATKRLLSNTSTPVLAGDSIYSALTGGALVCLDASNGNQIWQNTNVTTLKSGASLHITPCGKNALIFTDEGMLILATLSRDGYKELSRAKLIEPTSNFAGKRAWVPPSFADGRVFARNDREIVCVDLRAQRQKR